MTLDHPYKRNDFAPDDIAIIRQVAGRGHYAVEMALGFRFSRRGIRKAALRHGIQIVDPYETDAADDAGAGMRAVRDIRNNSGGGVVIDARVRVRRGDDGFAGVHHSAFNRSFGAPSAPSDAKLGKKLLAKFTRDSAEGLKPFMDLAADECHWPQDTPDGPRYCGQKQGQGTGRYCPDCYERSVARDTMKAAQ